MTLLLSVSGGWRVGLPWVSVIAVLLIGRHGRYAIPLVLTMLVAACAGSFRYQIPASNIDLQWGNEMVIVGEVADVPVLEGMSRRFLLETNFVDAPDELETSIRLLVRAPDRPETRLGDIVRLQGQGDPIADLAPGLVGFARSRGALGTLRADHLEIIGNEGDHWLALATMRQRVVQVLRRAVPGDGGALLAGFVTGDDSALSPDVDAAFRRTNTTHITAVSGANIALLVGLAVAIGGHAGWRRNGTWQLITLSSLWGYAGLTGLNPPVVRAALLASFALLALRFGRRPDYMTILALTAGAMALIEPRQIHQLSFQLSFTAFFALLLVLPRFAGSDWKSLLALGLVLPAVAHMSTLPLLLGIGGGFSLLSIPANILIAPAVSLAFPLALLTGAVGLVFPSAAAVLGGVASLLTWYILEVVVWLDARGATVVIGAPSGFGARVLWACLLGLFWVVSSEGTRTWRHFAMASKESSRSIVILLFASICGAALMTFWLTVR